MPAGPPVSVGCTWMICGPSFFGGAGSAFGCAATDCAGAVSAGAGVVTATVAGAISAIANFALIFGGNDRERPGGVVGVLALSILAPMAAALVQMAISRGREYEADKGGAEISGDPRALAGALEKIDAYAKGRLNLTAERNPATGQMFIINPLHGHGADNLFSTHPATHNRVKALLGLRGSEVPGHRPARTGTAVPPSHAKPWG